MMKRNLILLLLVLAGTAFMPAMAQKFGHVNSQELLLAMPERTTIEKTIEGYAKELESQLKAMEAEWQGKVNDYQTKEATMTPLIKQTKAKEIQDLETRIRTFQQTAQEDLGQKEQELLQPMIEKAKKAIEDVAKENKFTYIFDSSQGSLLYMPESDNVLPLVKKKLGITTP